MKGFTASAFDSLEPRYLLANIGPDLSFGAAGIVSFPAGVFVKTLANDQILAVNTDDDSIQEVDSTGAVASGFGTNGQVSLSGGVDIDRAAAGSSDLFLAVHKIDDATNLQIRAIKLSDGSVDTGFSSDGSIAVPSQAPGGSTVTSVAVGTMSPTTDGGLLITLGLGLQTGDQRIELVKLKANGSVDTSFASSGFLLLSQENVLGSAIWTSHGVVVATADDNGDAKLYRYKTDGTLDSSFGTVGSLDAGTAFGPVMLEQPDGKILLMGQSDDQTHGEGVQLNRYDVDGSLDSTFGSGGKLTLTDSSMTNTPDAFALDGSNRIVIATDIQLYRLTTTGALDTTFNGTGKFKLPGFHDTTTLAVDSQGRIVQGTDEQIERFATLVPVALGGDKILAVTGTSADDTLTVTEHASTITVTFNGAQTTYADGAIAGFNVNAGDGKNSISISLDLPCTVTTGDGDDTITTAGGADSINSNDGDDSINSGDGNDTVNAAGGDNTIISGNGSSEISAGQGNNTIQFGNGNNELTTGSGNLQITGGTGINSITLNDGDAQITLGGTSNTIQDNGSTGTRNITIGGGANTIDMRSAGNETISVGGVAGDFPNNITTSTGHNSVTCGDSNDLIFIGGDDTVSAGGGDDIIQPSDVLLPNERTISCHADGGAGDDIITPGNGNNVLMGGDGNDYLRTGVGNDSLYGNGGSDTIYAGGGDDYISGGGGKDHLFGQVGNDTVYGGNNNDALNGGPGADLVSGQAGDDKLFADDGEADRVYGGAGTDSATVDSSLDIVKDIEL